uniref:SH3 domain-containing protein n=1 Tax=Chenopodium quinoa TaxID=63459 RepID=A0A803MCV6_CHEQI
MMITLSLLQLNAERSYTITMFLLCWKKVLPEVVHPFDAQAEWELSLLANDIVVVQQVIPGGWSNGECNGKTGWFPSPYVQRLVEVSEGNVSWANLLQQ